MVVVPVLPDATLGVITAVYVVPLPETELTEPFVTLKLELFTPVTLFEKVAVTEMEALVGFGVAELKATVGMTLSMLTETVLESATWGSEDKSTTEPEGSFSVVVPVFPEAMLGVTSTV